MQVSMDCGIKKWIESLGWDKFLQLLHFFQVETYRTVIKIIRIIFLILFFNRKSAHIILIMDAVIVAVLGKFIEIIFLIEYNDTCTSLRIKILHHC